MAVRRPLLVLTILGVLLIAGISYAIVVAIVNGSQTPKVSWSSSGTTIRSLTLSFASPGSTSQTITFTCSPSAGPVTLKLTSSLESTVTLSQTNFPSCSSTPNTVTLTASSNTRLTIGGTLHVTQPYNYRTLAQPLQITVRAT